MTEPTSTPAATTPERGATSWPDGQQRGLHPDPGDPGTALHDDGLLPSRGPCQQPQCGMHPGRGAAG